MPRNSAGTFTLVPGNPVQSGDVVSSTWANSTLNDVADALTDSLDREGRGGMLAPFRFADGTNLLPGASWVNENTTGFYRFDGGDLRAVVLTQDVMRWRNSGAQVWNTTDSQWENILSSNSPVSIEAGTNDYQTTFWDNDDSEWKRTNAFKISDVGISTGGGNASSPVDFRFTDDVTKWSTIAAGGAPDYTINPSDLNFANKTEEGIDTFASLFLQAGSAPGGGSLATARIAAVRESETGIETALAFTVRGTTGEAMRIASTNNVGIGVADPAEKLEVDGTASIRSTGATTQLRLNRTDGDEYLVQAGLGTSNDEMRIQNATKSSEMLRIKSDGRVGIGVTNPSVKLQVDGDMRVSNGTFISPAGAGDPATPHYSFNGDPDTGMYRAASNKIGFATGGAERLTIQSSGILTDQVFCNTVYQTESGTAASPSVSWSNDTDTGMYRAASNQIGFATAGVERMRVKNGATTVTNGVSVDGIVAGNTSTSSGGTIFLQHVCSQSEYDNLTPNANTLYIII